MRVFEAMSEQVRTVPPTMGAGDAYQLMRTSGVHHLVVTSDAKIVGVLSDRDISARRRSPSKPAGVTVEDLMSSPVATIDREQTVRKAANVMEGRTIGCLPVTAEGRLVGIITTSDLLRLLGRGTDRPSPNPRPVLSHKVPHKKGRVGAGHW